MGGAVIGGGSAGAATHVGGAGGAGLGGAGGGQSGASSLAGGGQMSAAGIGGTAGTPSRADAVAAIEAACQTAVKECPQVTVDQCQSSNESEIPAETAPCFGAQLSVLQCTAGLPAAAFQCMANFAKPYPSYCGDENTALQDCYTAHPAM